MTQNNQLASPYLRLLHRNIILIIISVSVIPLILVSSTIYYQFRSSYREKVYVPLRELVALSAQRAKYSMVEIITDFPQDLPPLRISESEFQQVFLNLMNNAIDGMDKDGGALTISSRRRENHIVIEVSDTGKGIPEANLDRIFDPFFTTKPVGKGTGLGLSICYGLSKKWAEKSKLKALWERGPHL